MFSSREGVTMDSILRPLRQWLLAPSTTIPVAVALSLPTIVPAIIDRLSPDALVSIASSPLFSRFLDTLVDLSGRKSPFQKPACIIAAVAVALAANDYVVSKTANNWVEDRSWDWEKEIVLITGGSSGIGASVAQRFIRKNPLTRVVIVDSSPLTWTPPPDSLVHYYECDITDSDAIKDVGDRVRQDVGHPTVLFNNAGISRSGGVLESEHDAAVIQTNLTAQILMTKEFLQEMVIQDHGHIVFTGSFSSIIPMPRLASYSAAKAGLMAFHQALQMELKYFYNAPRVRQTLGIFSFVKTPMADFGKARGSFVLPFLDVESVSERLVDGVYSTRSSNIYMPGLVSLVTALRGGPEWLFRPFLTMGAKGSRRLLEKQNSKEDGRFPGVKTYFEAEKERAALRKQRIEAKAKE